MTLRWEILPKWVEIRIPSRDRHGKSLSREKRTAWIKRWREFLLNPEGMQGEGFESMPLKGTWAKGSKVIFDPLTQEMQIVEENVSGIRMYCSEKQLRYFNQHGRKLMIEMGHDLGQEAVAYSDSGGLHTAKIDDEKNPKHENDEVKKNRKHDQSKTQSN